MELCEHIYGVVEQYDFTNHVWAAVAYLDDSSVISAKTRRLCCAQGAFEIGGVYAASLSLVCRLPGMTRYGIRGARITLRRWFDGEVFTGADAPIEGIFWVVDAKKTADIFTLSGQDAMGWADTSSYNHTGGEDGLSAGIYGFGEFLAQLYGDGPVLQEWMLRCTQLANILAKRQTGMLQDLLVWRHYSKLENGGVEYCNNYVWTDHNIEDTSINAEIYLYTADGVYKDDNPRDFLRWLAQAAGGFITVTKDGFLTLRQFVQPSLGNAVVEMEDMELEGCEVADFRLQLYYTSVIFDDIQASAVGGGAPDSGQLVPYRICVEGNPFLNGFIGRGISGYPDYHNSLSWGLAMSMYHYGDLETPPRHCIARPFRVTVHTTDRYELGQRIEFPDWHDLDETQTHDLFSVITGVEWTFRGGTVLSCGGEDSRVMADCVRATKADKAVRELRSRFKA